MSVSESRADDLRIDVRALLGAVLSRWLRVVLVTVLLLGATFAVLMLLPKLYESSASVLVEQRSNAFTRAANEQPSSNAITIDAMVSSQIELIKSRDNLRVVIEELKLADIREFSGAGFSPGNLLMQLIGRKPEVKSGDETVFENLTDRLTVARQRDSAVISISVRSQDRQLAADIANAIARSAVQRRADLSLSDTAEASVWLEQEIAKLRTKVQEAETAVANYRVENDLLQSGTGQTSILDQQLSAIAAQVTSAQERKNSAQTRASLIRGMLKAGQPIDGIADVRESLVIQNLIQSKATLQGELAQRSSTLLSNHPTIKALRAQIAAVESQIAAEGLKVAAALESEAQAEASLEQSLNDDLARLKLSVSTATRDTVTLDGLQREAKAQRDLLESYLARYSDAAGRTDSSAALPDVRVVSFAMPSETPASPNVGLTLGAVGFLAVTLQVGTILFGALMSGRVITDRRLAADLDAPVIENDPDEPDLFDAEMPDAPPVAAPAAARHPFARAARTPEPDLDDEPAAVPDAEAAVDHHPEYEVVPTPPLQPEPAAPRPEPAVRNAGAAALELSNLAADLSIGRVRVVMLAALSSFRDVEKVAETLVSTALDRGLSVVTIDAGSARMSVEPGLTDLAADKASFGDVVHKVHDGLAAVRWGHQETLERRSMKPVTLIEALTDIYEVVIVSTGRIGVTSTLPVFSGVDCRLVLVAGDHADRDAVQSALSEAATLGYEVGQMVSAPPQRSVA